MNNFIFDKHRAKDFTALFISALIHSRGQQIFGGNELSLVLFIYFLQNRWGITRHFSMSCGAEEEMGRISQEMTTPVLIIFFSPV